MNHENYMKSLAYDANHGAYAATMRPASTQNLHNNQAESLFGNDLAEIA